MFQFLLVDKQRWHDAEASSWEKIALHMMVASKKISLKIVS